MPGRPMPRAVAQKLARITDVDAEPAGDGWDVPLANLRIHVSHDASAATPALSTLTLENRTAPTGTHLDTGV